MANIFQSFKQWWPSFVGKMNSLGVPVPMVRDPKTGVGSVSLTLVWLSATLFIVGVLLKWLDIKLKIETSDAFEFFCASISLYFGRNFGSKSGTQVTTTDPTQDPNSK